ncbi:hypothetical protein Peur_011212 [Populus x canadensis]
MIKEGVEPTVATYSFLINAYCLNGNVNGAMEIFKDMKATSKEGQHRIPPHTTLYSKALERRKIWKRRLNSCMKEHACNPDYITMEILTEWLSTVGETEKLKILLGDMTFFIPQRGKFLRGREPCIHVTVFVRDQEALQFPVCTVSPSRL